MPSINLFKYLSRKFSGSAKAEGAEYITELLPEATPCGQALGSIPRAQQMLEAETKKQMQVQPTTQHLKENPEKIRYYINGVCRDPCEIIDELTYHKRKSPISHRDHKPVSILKNTSSHTSIRQVIPETTTSLSATLSTHTSPTFRGRAPQSTWRVDATPTGRACLEGDISRHELTLVEQRHTLAVVEQRNQRGVDFHQNESSEREFTVSNPIAQCSSHQFVNGQSRPGRALAHNSSCPARYQHIRQHSQEGRLNASNVLMKSSSAPDKGRCSVAAKHTREASERIHNRGNRILSISSYENGNNRPSLGLTSRERHSSVGSLDTMCTRLRKGMRVRFERFATVYSTYNRDEYDRSPSAKTTGTREEMLSLYYELIKYKMTEMVIHEKSLANNNKHLFHLRSEERAEMLKINDQILAEYALQRRATSS